MSFRLRNLGITSIGHRHPLLDAVTVLPADTAPTFGAPKRFESELPQPARDIHARLPGLGIGPRCIAKVYF
jgi:hypothetical protein